ncbi:S8 family serine peptidase [bacterium]|nr:S8 family serine peptidase [bacterium]
MLLKFAKFGFCIILFFAQKNIFAGNFSTELETELLSSTQDQTVYVYFSEQPDLKPFKESFAKKQLTNSQKRDILVPKLQEIANRSQKNVISFLEKNKNSYLSYKSYFLGNLIFIEKAKPSLLHSLKNFSEVSVLEKALFPVKTTRKNSIPQVSEVSDALKTINADKLWALGFDGSGRIVANIDTGVDGNNPYLAQNWYGLQPNVSWNNAWYDAVGQNSTFPEDLAIPTTGTATMSLMVGKTITDTIGVAPNAWWISSKHNDGGPNTGVNGHLAGFTWIANLPANVLDKLDVINNSYGENFGGCSASGNYQIYEIIETMGIATVWAAGNDGPNNKTIWENAAGAISETHTFSVGALNTNQTSAWIYSAKGPSGCANSNIVFPPHNLAFQIKPEVVAQGSQIKVAKGVTTGGGTEIVSGTEFSTALVSGSIALLKQIKPTATVEEVKLALLNTTVDLGSPGDDNTYGRGRIDVLAAASEFSPFAITGNVTDNGNPIPFAKIKINQTKQETLTAVDGSYFLKPLVNSVTLEVSAFGYQTTTLNVPQLVAGSPFVLQISLSLKPTGTISGTFDDTNGNAVSGEVRIFTTGLTEFLFASVLTNSNGTFSLILPEENYKLDFVPNFPFPQKTGLQFSLVSGQNQVFNYSNLPSTILLFGKDNSQAVDTVYREILSSTGLDFFHWNETATLPTLSQLSLLTQPSVVIWYTDEKQGDVLSNFEEQLLVDYLNGNGKLVLSGQNILESETGGNLMNLIGISFGGNFTGVSDFVRGNNGSIFSNGGTGWLFKTLGINNENLQSSKDKILISGNSTQIAGYGGNGGEGIAATKTLGNNAVFLGFDVASVVASSPTLASSKKILHAILNDFGFTLETQKNQNPTLKNFVLNQNFPNPFNPTTKIAYELPNNQKAKLTIFNVLGEVVKEFSLEKQSSFVEWNGTNFNGKSVASGVYFYKLESENFSQTKKMVFLK